MPDGGADGARPPARRLRRETPKPGDPRLARAGYEIVGGRRDAMAGARAKPSGAAIACVTIDEPIVGEARDAGPALVARALSAGAPDARGPCCVVVVGRDDGARAWGEDAAAATRSCALAAATVAGRGRARVRAGERRHRRRRRPDRRGRARSSTATTCGARRAATALGERRGYLARQRRVSFLRSPRRSACAPARPTPTSATCRSCCFRAASG